MQKVFPYMFLLLCALVTGCCMDGGSGYSVYTELRFRDLKIRMGDSLGKVYRVYYMSPVNHTDIMNSREFAVKEPVQPTEFGIILYSDLGYDTMYFQRKKARREVESCGVRGNYEFFSLSGHTFDSIRDIDLPRYEYYEFTSGWNPFSTITVY